MKKDPRRYSDDRGVAWEVYRRNGKRIAIFEKSGLGTFPSPEVVDLLFSNPMYYCRLVTYDKNDKRL